MHELPKTRLTFGSLFAGIGGFDLGLERAGLACKWQVEINEFCQTILTKHWPDIPKFGDIKDVGKENLKTVDVIVGGFPCQDVSVAGWQRGIKEGTRSGLFFEAARVICEIRPKWVVIENVRGLLSSNAGRDFSTVLWELSKIGYDAEWHVVSGCAFGFPHTRERLFIIAYPSGNGRKGNLCEIISQEENNWPLKTLDTWIGFSDTLPDVEKLMAEPGNYRLADGIPSTLAVRPSLRAYGNAVMPPIAEFIGNVLIAAENKESYERTNQQPATA